MNKNFIVKSDKDKNIFNFKLNDKVVWYDAGTPRGSTLIITKISENEIKTNDGCRWFLNGEWKGNAHSVYWNIKPL